MIPAPLSVTASEFMPVNPDIRHQESDGSCLDSDEDAVNAAVDNSLASDGLASGGAPNAPTTQNSVSGLSTEGVNIGEIWKAIIAGAITDAGVKRVGIESPSSQTPCPKRSRTEKPQLATTDALTDGQSVQPTGSDSDALPQCQH